MCIDAVDTVIVVDVVDMYTCIDVVDAVVWIRWLAHNHCADSQGWWVKPLDSFTQFYRG